MHTSAASVGLRYALADGDYKQLLMPGRNVVGRSPCEPEGVHFLTIESPRGAISRVQALIDIAPNGDAWISDCESTNGTYLSVRPGAGIRLEPNHYYQLSVGSSVLFGDVRRTFVEVEDADEENGGEAPKAAVAPRSPPAAAFAPLVSVRPAMCSGEAPAEILDEVRKARSQAKAAGKEAAGALHSVPYLADVQLPVSGTKRARASTSSKEDALEAPAAKTVATGSSKSDVSRKNRSSTPQTSSNADALTTPLVVCTSGMDADEKTRAKKAVKAHGGSFTEDVVKATLLAVGLPAVRTPKFIIAVARGIPIVGLECLELAPPLGKEALRAHTVPLKDNGRTYTSAMLRDVIFRGKRDPLLCGLTFRLKGISGRTRQVAQEVIAGCGGRIAQPKSDPDVEVASEKALNDLYDCVLRGRQPG